MTNYVARLESQHQRIRGIKSGYDENNEVAEATSEEWIRYQMADGN